MNKTNDNTPADPIEELRPLVDWWKKNGVRSVITLAIVLAAGSGAGWFLNQQRRKQEEASQAFGGADSIMKLETYVNRFAGTKPAVSARLKLAKAYYDAGRYPLALETYENFLSDHPDHPMADIARLGRPHTLEAMGRYNEALEAFDKFAADNPGHYLEGPAVFGAARCVAVLRNKPDAIRRLEEFLETHPESIWREQAYAEIEWIRTVDRENPADNFFASPGTNVFETLAPVEAAMPAPSDTGTLEPAPAPAAEPSPAMPVPLE